MIKPVASRAYTASASHKSLNSEHGLIRSSGATVATTCRRVIKYSKPLSIPELVLSDTTIPTMQSAFVECAQTYCQLYGKTEFNGRPLFRFLNFSVSFRCWFSSVGQAVSVCINADFCDKGQILKIAIVYHSTMDCTHCTDCRIKIAMVNGSVKD